MPWRLVLAQQPPPPDPMASLLPTMLLMFGFVYFFIIRPQRREQKEKDALLAGLKKNDRVVTTGGMFGTISSIKDDEVTLRVDDKAKVQVRFQKAAIAKVLGAGGDEPESKNDGPDAPKSSS